MPSKNDLTAFTQGKATKQSKILKPAKASPKGQGATSETRGRKAKPIAEKESAVIALKLTEAEKKALAKKAGMVPLATYLKSYLRDKTDLFG